LVAYYYRRVAVESSGSEQFYDPWTKDGSKLQLFLPLFIRDVALPLEIQEEGASSRLKARVWQRVPVLCYCGWSSEEGETSDVLEGERDGESREESDARVVFGESL